jgi:hyperosmotically inducible protein
MGSMTQRRSHGWTLGVTVVTAVLLLAPTGAGAADPAESKIERPTEKARDKGEDAKGVASDSWLTAKTKIALAADDRVKARQIDVETNNATVTLRGKVDSAEAKSAAEAVAKGVDGVKAVKNNLQVVPPAQREAVAANDKDITRVVKDRLAAETRLKNADIDVATDAGVVTLKGDAPTLSASARASEVARGVEGVRAVRNELTVKTSR